MKERITRETYEELKGKSIPGVHVDVECFYYISTDSVKTTFQRKAEPNPEPLKFVKYKGRRSPTDKLALRKKPSGLKLCESHELAYLAIQELFERTGEVVICGRALTDAVIQSCGYPAKSSTASGIVTVLIQKGVLGIVQKDNV